MDNRSESFRQPPGIAPAASVPNSSNAAPSRASPFASGPVAMVNQIRPGHGGPGQFPGGGATSAPTQLSTPLGLPRRASSPPKPAPQSGHDLFGTATPQRSSYSAPDPFGSLGAAPAPPFQIQAIPSAAPDLFPRVERASAETLFGAPTGAAQPGRVNQQGSYNNLFGSPQSSEGTRSAPSSQRQSQSFSYGQASQTAVPPRNNTQEQQASQPPPLPLRPTGQQPPPPPAAPFLGYGDNSNSRSQSFRGGGSAPVSPLTSSTGSRTSLSPSIRPGVPHRSSSGGSLPAPSPPRAGPAVRSSDELLDEFLRLPVDDRFHDPCNPTAAEPPASKLLLSNVADSIESLESLYRQKRWKSLTKKTLAMLQNPGNDPVTTLAIKSWWLAGLIKNGQIDNATSVLHQIGDIDDPAILESAGASGGSLAKMFVPIRLRLLEALVSKCKGNFALHEKQLFQLTSKLRNAIKDDISIDTLGVSADVAARWLRLAEFALVNHLVQQHKFALALRVCAKIEIDQLTTDEKVVVVSRIGRVNLQMGDLVTAEKMFALARSCIEQLKASQPVPTDQEANLVAQLEVRLLVNDGLLLFAQNKLQEALSAFDSVLELEARRVKDFYSEAGQNPAKDDEELILDEDFISVAINNYAICALYCCDVKGAVTALERMVRANPTRFLNSVVVFNLSSLYDLIYDNANSATHKEMMKKLADMYDLEHVDPAAFRI